MDVQIIPSRLHGCVTPPASKSAAHRLLLSAALAEGVSTLRNLTPSEDLEATLRCLTALGAAWERTSPDTLRVRGVGGRCRAAAGALPRFDCGESGSTLRFLIPIALALCGGGVFTGRGRLMERPQEPYAALFARKGILWDLRDGVLTVRGTLTPGEYALPGHVSSQFFTGLLFALPLLDGPSRLCALTPLESRNYVDLTLQVLRDAGGTVQAEGDTFRISPFIFRPRDAQVEADWSQAGFWYAARFLGQAVRPTGLDPASLQGDRVLAAYTRRLAAPGPAELDLSDCPDLLPPLAVMAAVRPDPTHFVNAARLRLKESDRLSTTAALLQALGAAAEEEPAGLLVRGGRELHGGTVDGANDHRIVMAAAVAASVCSGPVTIHGAEAVNKSYPTFFQVYQQLGGIVHVL